RIRALSLRDALPIYPVHGHHRADDPPAALSRRPSMRWLRISLAAAIPGLAAGIASATEVRAQVQADTLPEPAPSALLDAVVVERLEEHTSELQSAET